MIGKEYTRIEDVTLRDNLYTVEWFNYYGQRWEKSEIMSSNQADSLIEGLKELYTDWKLLDNIKTIKKIKAYI